MRLATPLLIVSLLTACSDGAETGAKQDAPLPSVVVEAVTSQDIAGQVDFVGRTEASQRVDIRARVSGTLLERPFKEGDAVEEGALLFKIDPAEFQANVTTAEAQLAKAEASFDENERNRKRYEVLLERETASQAQYDIAKSQADQSQADVEAAKAELERAKLDLGYTTITSPIAGRSGIANVDVGNLIGPDSGVLVTVLALDPIDVIFSVGERDYLNYTEAAKTDRDTSFTPQIRLANNALYGQTGKVDVIDNKVDPATGTITVRLEFPNPDRLLVPGQYVSVLLTGATPEKRIVIPQAAVQENQAGPFVLIVDGEGRVQSRPVKTGDRVGDSVVVREGLTEGETLVVEGIQKVRPGAEVTTDFRKPADEPEVIDPEASPEAPAGTPDPTPDNESETGP
ncbi:efflux RND transporter periplasmic adaptor subunit [Methyloligella sp. 2.7D]|uniref:efflux RND transporter periplasmic adaptor subunit n=1 Tax=unclassified Methyloligella TaxID=2625955 RepID=UPI00157DA3DB|nr:efflux RND transporter periplasmic adaptor subunit [Methyloligella sp. GL2]QKP77274.1 efflux RND transporter periplasmic adaptor subunit [Methyloligella sp. GL2]